MTSIGRRPLHARGIRCALLVAVVAGCRSAPAPREVAESERAVVVDAGAAADGRVAVPGEGCVASSAERVACRALGPACGLASRPERDPCAGKGTWCAPELIAKREVAAPCWCTCADLYRARAEEARDRSKDPVCRETTDLTTGEHVTTCDTPELPR